MKILVTGANGFLGRHLVEALSRRGHAVRAMVRPAADVTQLGWDASVEIYRADLRVHPNLDSAFEGVDALIHLAATVVGDADGQLSETVVGTTRLLRSMANSQTKRLVLASSFSVYDFNGVRGTLTEKTPIDPKIYDRDGYAIAKYWQERLTRQAALEHGWNLTVLRPGFIWGKGNDYLACLGQSFGAIHLVIGPLTRLPLTHVTNCADCFADAVENPRAIGQTFNVVDDDSIRAWKYMGEYLRGSGEKGVRIPIPYRAFLLLTYVSQRSSKIIFKGKGKLPSLLVPCRFIARFKPLRYTSKAVRDALGWQPRQSFKECVALTWPIARANTTPAESVSREVAVTAL